MIRQAEEAQRVNWIELADESAGIGTEPLASKTFSMPVTIELRDIGNPGHTYHCIGVVLSLPPTTDKNSTYLRRNVVDVLRHQSSRSELGLVWPADILAEAQAMLRRAEVLRYERELEEAKARLAHAVEAEKNQGQPAAKPTLVGWKPL